MPVGFVAAIVLDCQFGSFCLCFLLVWFGIPAEERISPKELYGLYVYFSLFT